MTCSHMCLCSNEHVHTRTHINTHKIVQDGSLGVMEPIYHEAASEYDTLCASEFVQPSAQSDF